MKKIFILAILLSIAALARYADIGKLQEKLGGESSASSVAGDEVFGEAFARNRGNFFAEGSGTVTRVLSDDNDGSRHQRFIVALKSGQTLLIAHNIDIAPRVDALAVGDSVTFKGEYEWNDKGGVVHWTHRDPAGAREGGWIQHNGRTYR